MSHPSNQSTNGVNVSDQSLALARRIMDMAEADKGLSLNSLAEEIGRWCPVADRPIKKRSGMRPVTGEEMYEYVREMQWMVDCQTAERSSARSNEQLNRLMAEYEAANRSAACP